MRAKRFHRAHLVAGIAHKLLATTSGIELGRRLNTGGQLFLCQMTADPPEPESVTPVAAGVLECGDSSPLSFCAAAARRNEKESGDESPHSKVLEVGDLAFPLPMNTEYVWDHAETFTRRMEAPS